MNFGRNKGFLSIAVLCAWLAGTVSTAAFQRRVPHKLRAIALLEITTGPTGTVGTQLTPIAILDNKRFHDAGIYESRPRPMAIADGVVYEAQKTGLPVGYATIISAEKKKDLWIAQGRWQLASEIQPPKPSTVTAPAPGSDRPILRRPGSSEAKPPASAPSPSTAPAAAPAPAPVEAPEDPDRPRLKRQPNSVPETLPASGKPAPARPIVSSAPGVQALVAVSDAEQTYTRSYEYIWKAGELQEAEARMRKLALAQLPTENRKGPPPELTNVVIRSFDLDLSNDAVLVLTAEVPGGSPAPAANGAPVAPAKPVTINHSATWSLF